mgnify:FL=1
MFLHIFTYRLKCLLRNRENIFWTLLFPLILATLFYFAFSNLNSAEAFSAIDIAVVDNEQYRKDENFKAALEKASTGNDRLFNVSVVSGEKADEMLMNSEIDGYIIVDWPIRLVVSKSGMKQTIIKTFIDNYMHTFSAVSTLMSETPDKIQNLAYILNNRINYVREVSGTTSEPNNILLYFYSLIAMTCFYGGFWGMREVSDIQADISAVAARVNTAPVHKLKTFLYNSFASVIIHLSEMFIMLAYLVFVLDIDFGQKSFYVLLTVFIGSLAGFYFGAFISAIVRKQEGLKVGIMVSVTMICTFFAGMMNQDIKYIISRKAPLLAYLNPISLLTDAFYALYYYDTLTRFFSNIAVLAVFTAAFCTGTYLIIRRQKYASL